MCSEHRARRDRRASFAFLKLCGLRCLSQGVSGLPGFKHRVKFGEGVGAFSRV